MPAFGDAFLYTSRPVDPFTLEFPKQAWALVQLFGAFEQHRHNFQLTLAIMFGLLAAIMLLSAVWLGLAFTNGLVGPIAGSSPRPTRFPQAISMFRCRCARRRAISPISAPPSTR